MHSDAVIPILVSYLVFRTTVFKDVKNILRTFLHYKEMQVSMGVKTIDANKEHLFSRVYL